MDTLKAQLVNPASLQGSMRQSTPQAIIPQFKGAPAQTVTPPRSAPSPAGNAQTEAYGRAMRSAVKNTNTFK